MYICKNRSQITQNYPQQRKAWWKKLFECSVHQGYTKNICTKFHEKILNSYEVLDKHCPNEPKNTPLWLPRRVMIWKKIVQWPKKENQEHLYKISQNILNRFQKVDVIYQNRPPITLKDRLKMGTWCQKKSISDNQSYAKNIWTKLQDKILNRCRER